MESSALEAGCWQLCRSVLILIDRQKVCIDKTLSTKNVYRQNRIDEKIMSTSSLSMSQKYRQLSISAKMMKSIFGEVQILLRLKLVTTFVFTRYIYLLLSSMSLKKKKLFWLIFASYDSFWNETVGLWKRFVLVFVTAISWIRRQFLLLQPKRESLLR